MKVTMTAIEIIDAGLWDRYCDLVGLNPWAVNEGLLDGDQELTVPPELIP